MSSSPPPKYNNEILQKHAEEIEEIGYFAALNLNYNCSESEIKKNYEEIFRQLQLHQARDNDEDNEQNLNSLTQKLDLQTKRKLMRRIVDAYKVLENENLRKKYLEEIKIRCYMSQVVSIEQLLARYSGRLFPFFIFELHKKANGIFGESSHRFFHINFIEMIMEERKDERLIRAFNFSSLNQAVCGFKKNELYLSITNGKTVETFHYQVKYPKQRSLLVELILFAKRLAIKRASSVNSENMINPTEAVPANQDQRSEQVVENMLGVQMGSQNNVGRSLKLLTNDRITPAKQIFQCEIFTKNNFLSSQKKYWLHVGTSQILLSTDKTANHITQIFPIDREYMSLLKLSESGSNLWESMNRVINLEFQGFSISCKDSKQTFFTKQKEDVDTILELTNQIEKEKVQNDHIIYSLPYNKKDLNVMRMIASKLKLVDTKITETKAHLKNLEKEKSHLMGLFMKEKEKTKLDPDLEKTIFSEISSLRQIASKSGASFDRTPCSMTTISLVSRTIIEEQGGSTPSDARTGESRVSHNHHLYSKSMTFTDKTFDLRVNTQTLKNISSPDYYKNNSFGDAHRLDSIKSRFEQGIVDIETPHLGQQQNPELESPEFRLNKTPPSRTQSHTESSQKEIEWPCLDFCAENQGGQEEQENDSDNEKNDDVNKDRLHKICSPNNHFKK